jgi:putative glutamine amidotransferase
MSNNSYPVRIGVYGNDPGCASHINRHPGLWQVGYAGSLTAAGAVPVELCAPRRDSSWGEVLEEIDGVVFAGFPEGQSSPVQEDAICRWCRDHKLPFLAIDHGLLSLNSAFGGLLHQDLCRELPEALQHRHPPEEGIRHAINVLPKTHLANTYGEGEVIVNSEHRKGIQRPARGFRISGQALDGVIEALEWDGDDWFALGVQWQPASASASGLDIQVFRALVDAATARAQALAAKATRTTRPLARAA